MGKIIHFLQINPRFPRLFVLCLFLVACGYHEPVIRTLPNSKKVTPRTLFIAFDGIAYSMMAELKSKGYYKDFQDPIPLIVPFPTATTIGFTGIFKPVGVGKVPGYESRFFSHEQNKVVGGTPWEIYKIPVPYKTYFDAFRHTMFEKSVMYTFPGVAGTEDLRRAEDLLRASDKQVLFAYLGGTDGSQHVLGKERTRRFMIYADRFLSKMKKNYKGPLRIVLFSDHGFQYSATRMVWGKDIRHQIEKSGFKTASHLDHPEDVLFVKFGLLSAGVVMTKTKRKEELASCMVQTKGMDLIFWPEGDKIFIVNRHGAKAYFEYHWPSRYRYIVQTGDPLNYLPAMRKKGYKSGQYLKDSQWHAMTWDQEYPDAGFRLYDSFHNLVENEASMLFSLLPDYQFGGLAPFASTQLKWRGHKGTHGGLFKEVSYGVVMTDAKVSLPSSLRYDQFFPYFLPEITKAVD